MLQHTACVLALLLVGLRNGPLQASANTKSTATIPKDADFIARKPYTNAEAFRRGLPPLKPRSPSRSWTAVKRQSSAVSRDIILTFDEDQFDDQVMAGPLAGLNYQGINLGCQTAECQYVSLRNYPRYGSISAPHAMGFRARDLPSLSSAVQGGKVRLKTLYCAQTSGTTVPLTARGFIGGEEVYAEILSCTPNNFAMPNGNTVQQSTLNDFGFLPLVDEILFTVPTGTNGIAGWGFDDISLTLVV